MAEYSANSVVKTVIIHKDNCPKIPYSYLQDCGCGDRGKHGNQRWWCEDHITFKAVNGFMKGKFWAILMCNICYGTE